jgi:hypothetical protein
VLTVHEQVGVQEAGVHDMSAGQEASLLQRGVDLGGHRPIGCGAGCGCNVRDQVRQIILTGFREMHCIAHPLRGVLTGIVGVEVIGGADEPRCRGEIVRLSPLELGAVPQIILDPDSAQDGDGGHLAQPKRGIRMIDGCEQAPAIMPNGQRQGGTGCLCGREPVILSPSRLAVPPVGRAHGA